MNYSVSDGFLYYIECIGNNNYMDLFLSDVNRTLLRSITEEQSTFRYAAGKWSIKQIMGHITDHERIMTYRMLRFSRNDSTLLPRYDQNLLVENSRFDEQPFQQLLIDFENVRAATISFIQSLSAKQLQRTGLAWKFEMTVEDFLKATIGHEVHHIKIIKERYLNQA